MKGMIQMNDYPLKDNRPPLPTRKLTEIRPAGYPYIFPTITWKDIKEAFIFCFVPADCIIEFFKKLFGRF